MPSPMASLGPLVHPHQLEVQEFDAYGLVIDARSLAEYEEDHIPRAVHLPVDQAAPDALSAHVRQLRPEETVLVYCSRGGVDSLVWAEPLRGLGFTVDVLGGGWPNYRRWVAAGLESLARSLTFKRLQGPPLGGVDLVLAALAARGEQVLNLAEIAGQRGVTGFPLPDDAVPSQSAFESRLVDAMRRFDPGLAVWIGDRLYSLGELKLPASLREALGRASGVAVSATLDDRLRYLANAGLDRSIEDLIEALRTLPPTPSTDLIARCHQRLAEGRLTDALAVMIEDHVDPSYAPISALAPAAVLNLMSLDPASVGIAVEGWLTREAAARPGDAQIRP